MWQGIDAFLNRITMYRLTVYVLLVVLFGAVIFGSFGLVPYTPVGIVATALVLVTSCFLANRVIAGFFVAATSLESVLITALILALVVPASFPGNILFLLTVSFAAMGSKYLVTIDKQHLFNPAAAALVTAALLTDQAATWWVGAPVLLPLVLVGGFLIVRKMGRERMVAVFLIIYLLITAVVALGHDFSLRSLVNTWRIVVLNSALFFFATVMFTEPLTTPFREGLRDLYAVIVAILYSFPQLRFVGFILPPEMALVLGNLFSYVVNPKYRLELPLKKKVSLSAATMAFAFSPSRRINFSPGQYFEWVLSHPNPDDRGNRRYFSLASSPTEENLMIAAKFPENPSSYKRALQGMEQGQKVLALHLAGDFVLPKDLNRPLVLIAGGIGVTPYRSMAKYIIDNQLKADIVLLYSERKVEDLIFRGVFKKAAEYGLKPVYCLTDRESVPSGWAGEVGRIDEQMIKAEVPDFAKRTFYVSGPQLFVQAMQKTLENMGVKAGRVVTDYFPGYSES